MSATLAGDTKIVKSPTPPVPRAARVSLLALVQEWLFGVSLLGVFIGAAGLAILAPLMRLVLAPWVDSLAFLGGDTSAGAIGGATAGGLLAIPLVVLMVILQDKQSRGLRSCLRADLRAWALCVAVMAVVGAIGENIGGWAGWMIGGTLVGAIGGRFLETK